MTKFTFYTDANLGVDYPEKHHPEDWEFNIVREDLAIIAIQEAETVEEAWKQALEENGGLEDIKLDGEVKYLTGEPQTLGLNDYDNSVYRGEEDDLLNEFTLWKREEFINFVCVACCPPEVEMDKVEALLKQIPPYTFHAFLVEFYNAFGIDFDTITGGAEFNPQVFVNENSLRVADFIEVNEFGVAFKFPSEEEGGEAKRVEFFPFDGVLDEFYDEVKNFFDSARAKEELELFELYSEDIRNKVLARFVFRTKEKTLALKAQGIDYDLLRKRAEDFERGE